MKKNMKLFTTQVLALLIGAQSIIFPISPLISSAYVSDAGIRWNSSYNLSHERNHRHDNWDEDNSDEDNTDENNWDDDTDTVKPSTPTDFKVSSATTTSINLSWSNGSYNTSVTGYVVYRNNVVAGTTNSKTFLDSGLNPQTTYTYMLQSFDKNGNLSDKTSQFSATTATLITTADLTAPTQPQNLKQTASTASSISISWDASSDINGISKYEIYRNNTQIAAVQNVVNFTDAVLAQNTSYTYSVRSFDPSNNASPVSTQITAWTSNNDNNQISTLYGYADSSLIRLYWNPVPTAIGYTVYKSTTNGTFTSLPINGTTPITLTAFTHLYPSIGTNYYIVKPIFSNNSEGLASNQVNINFSSSGNTNIAVSGFSGVSENRNVRLNWTSTSNAIGYNIYYSTTSGVYSSIPVFDFPLTGNTYLYTKNVPGNNYFIIKPVFSGNIEGIASNEVNITITYPPISGLTGNIEGSGIKLTWDAMSNAIGYNVYSSTITGNYSTTPLNTMPITSTSFLHNSPTSGINYYTVKPVFSNNILGSVSAEISITFSANTIIVLSGNIEGTGIRLNWEPVINVIGYNIYVAPASRAYSLVPVNSSPITTTTHLHITPMAGANYFIVKPVYSGNSIGNTSNEIVLNYSYRKTIVLQVNNKLMMVNGSVKYVDSQTPNAAMPELNSENGRVFIPISSLITELGGTTQWDEANSKVTINYANKKIEMYIGQTYMMLYNNNSATGQRIYMDVAPYINATFARTMLPIRFVIQYLGENVQWDAASRTVTINQL